MDKSTSESTPAAEITNTPSGKKSPAKTKTKSKSRVRRPATSHPPTSEMVLAAIKELKDRKGSSLQAIKKYIVATYKVDGDKLAPFIKRYLKAAVTSGDVVQTKGKGASGSFKLPGSKIESKPKAPKSPKSPKTSKAAAPKSPTKKEKVERATKAAAKKSKAVAEKTEKKKAAKATIAIKPKTPIKVTPKKPVVKAKAASKTKKTAKAPAAKTRTPKPKRSSTPSRAAAKK